MNDDRGGRFGQVPAEAIFDSRVTPSLLRVLCALSTYSNQRKGGWCYPSQATLGRRLDISRQAVGKSIDQLVALGYVNRQTKSAAQAKRHPGYLYQVRLDFPPPTVDEDAETTGMGEQRDVAFPHLGEQRDVAFPATPEVATPATSGVAVTHNGTHHRTHQPFLSDLPSADPDEPKDGRLVDKAWSDDVRRLTRELATGLLANGFKVPAKNTKRNGEWLRDMDRLLRIDKADATEVGKVIVWAAKDEFWRGNIRSPEKLRKHYPALKLKMNDELKVAPAAAGWTGRNARFALQHGNSGRLVGGA